MLIPTQLYSQLCKNLFSIYRLFINSLLIISFLLSSTFTTPAKAAFFEKENPFATTTTAKKQKDDSGCISLFQKFKNLLPGARLKLLNAEKKKALSHIIGQVRIKSKDDSRSQAEFDLEMDLETRKNAGNGDALIEAFGQINKNSPTTLRVEEKRVNEVTKVAEFIASTQTKEFADKFNGGELIKWTLRDTPPPGYKFMTLTEYGQHLSFVTSTKAVFIAKPRYRKYFRFPIGHSGQIDKYESSMGSLMAFEIKMTSDDGPNDGSFLGTEDTVFKPRIWVNDELADELKKIDGRDNNLEKTLSSIKSRAKALKKDDGSLANNPIDVDSIIQSLVFFLNKDPDFLRPTHTVHYERTSYEYESPRGEYQATTDENVKIFVPQDMPSADMIKYLNAKPVFQSKPEHAFMELKSPVKEKINNGSPLHNELMRRLEVNHINDYKKGGGKYSLARQVDMTLLDQHLDDTLFKMGTAYWLLTGSMNLDTLPKKNDLVTLGEIEVAYPFTTSDGKVYRIFLRYKPTFQPNGNRIGVLEKVKILDEFGFSVKVKNDLDSVVWMSNRRMDEEFMALDLEGSIIPFKTFLTSEEMNDYKSFFMSFFANDTDLKGKPRSLDDMNHIKSGMKLALYKAKLTTENLLKALYTRTWRLVFSAGATAAAIFAINSYVIPQGNLQPVTEVPDSNSIQVQLPDGISAQISYSLVLEGFTYQPNVESAEKIYRVSLIYAQELGNKSYFSVYDKNSEFYKLLIDGQIIVLKAYNGEEMKFRVQNKNLYQIKD